VVPVRICKRRSISVISSYPLVVCTTSSSAALQLRKRLVYNPSSPHAALLGPIANSLKIGGKQGALSPCLSLSDLPRSSLEEPLDEGW
jgi:hypothetical protein